MKLTPCRDWIEEQTIKVKDDDFKFKFIAQCNHLWCIKLNFTKADRKEIREFIKQYSKCDKKPLTEYKKGYKPKKYVTFELKKGDLIYASRRINSNCWYTTFLKNIPLSSILTVGEEYEVTPYFEKKITLKYLTDSRSDDMFVIINNKKSNIKK